MDFKKNKMNIIIVVALVVVCGGSFLGVKAMSDKIDTGTTVPSVYEITTPAPTTTEPTTTAPTTTAPTTVAPTSEADLSATLKIESVITTFPVSSNTNTTTTQAPTTTEPTTTEPTTTEPTTERTTAPTTTKPTTTKKNTANNGGIFGEGLAGYQYNTSGNFYYTSSDPWQRALGYNEIFDVGAGLVTIYMDTMRCKFDYKDQNWMIQFWKGQYGLVFVGHEIGVYTKPKSRTTEHYDAASNEDALYMELTGYRDGKELYHRDYAKYWWCTGFVPGTLDNLMDRSELSLKCRITMKDYDMLLGFCDALKSNGMVLGEDYATDGLDVLVTW
ncbi:MAG: DUF4474 domain-containing protein [Clostridia bacterium]|nr:DUF4474 domain-containing protein [Clostridia bacterium]